MLAAYVERLSAGGACPFLGAYPRDVLHKLFRSTLRCGCVPRRPGAAVAEKLDDRLDVLRSERDVRGKWARPACLSSGRRPHCARSGYPRMAALGLRLWDSLVAASFPDHGPTGACFGPVLTR